MSSMSEETFDEAVKGGCKKLNERNINMDIKYLVAICHCHSGEIHNYYCANQDSQVTRFDKLDDAVAAADFMNDTDPGAWGEYGWIVIRDCKPIVDAYLSYYNVQPDKTYDATNLILSWLSNNEHVFDEVHNGK